METQRGEILKKDPKRETEERKKRWREEGQEKVRDRVSLTYAARQEQKAMERQETVEISTGDKKTKKTGGKRTQRGPAGEQGREKKKEERVERMKNWQR